MSDEIRITQNWSAELLRELDVVSAGEVITNSKFAMLMRLLILPIGFVIIATYLTSLWPQSGGFLLGLPFGVAAMGIYSGFVARRVEAKFTKATLSSPIRSEPAEITLSPEGVHTSSSLFREHIEWPAVTVIVESKLALHIMLSATNSLPIPYDALPEGVTRDELRQRVDAWRGAAGE